jgi:hypothetical protein
MRVLSIPNTCILKPVRLVRKSPLEMLCVLTAATWLVTGTTGQVAFDGLAPRAIPSGTFGEVYGDGAEFFYADSGLTIGTAIWVSNTAGKLADARVAAAGTDQPVGIVRTATNVQLVRGV